MVLAAQCDPVRDDIRSTLGQRPQVVSFETFSRLAADASDRRLALPARSRQDGLAELRRGPAPASTWSLP